MKKLLLSTLLLSSLFTAKAQTVIYSENFNSGITPSPWTLNDADGDGNNWSVVQITEANGSPSTVYPTPVLRSASWNAVTQAALTPNNWIFSHAIDLSAYAGQTITLTWKASAADADWDAEKYSVYVSNANTTTAMLASSTKFTETLSGVNKLTQRSLDISALAGQSAVYFAFRHYESTDQFTMEIDDITIITGKLSNEKFFTENFNLYPNPTSDVLNISSKNGLEMKEIKITDLSGRIVKTLNNATTINVSDLSAGTYLIDITTNEGKASSKFVKK